MTPLHFGFAASYVVAGLAEEKPPRIGPSVPRIGRWVTDARSERLLLFRAGGRSRRLHRRGARAARSQIDAEPSAEGAGKGPRRPAAQSHFTPVRNDGSRQR